MINSLQSIRFFFALMIFYHHYFRHPIIEQFGTLPVSFFFILSGFVMTLSYEDKVESSSFVYKSYIIKRIKRICPLNIFCLALMLMLTVSLDYLTNSFKIYTYLLYILDLFLIQAWIPIKTVYFSGNAVAWFLSSMLFCYIAFPWILKRLKKNLVLLMLIVLSLYFIIIQFIHGDYIHALIYINPIFRVVDFMIGISLGIVLKKKEINVKNKTISTCIEIFSICFVIISLLVYDNIPVKYGTASLYWLPSLFLIYALAIGKNGVGIISCCLRNKTLVYFGSLSFPIYMIHRIVIRFYHIVENHMPIDKESIIGFVICLLLTIIISHFFVKYIEPSVLKIIKS